MWPFKRNKSSPKYNSQMPPCPQCKSANIRVISYQEEGDSSFIKVWRGERYVTCRCLNCGFDFYVEESSQNIDFNLSDNDLIDNPEALRAAEDRIKQDLEDKDDRMFPG